MMAAPVVTCPLHGQVEAEVHGKRLKCPSCGQFLARGLDADAYGADDNRPLSAVEVERLLDDNDDLQQEVGRLKVDLRRAVAIAEAEQSARKRVEVELDEAKTARLRAEKERADQTRTISALGQQVAALQARVDRLRQAPLSGFFDG